ncbi:hypothetical protein GCM10020000_73630 [Streptomyces olivoverticillatus]
MHRYDFELSAGREAFYAGKAVHGYFTREVLDLQQGMDGGRLVAPWFERQPAPPAGTLRIDARGDTRLGHGRMAFLEDLAVVPGGGDHGAGYVLCSKPVRADDWYFDHHFYKDPVMPGSTGVQMLLQAVQAFALHTGLTDGRLHPVVGEELHWTYRAQMLREHRRARGEVHIRKVRRKRGRLFVHAEGSVWRDDLRIYHVENIVLATRPPATRAETAELMRGPEPVPGDAEGVYAVLSALERPCYVVRAGGARRHDPRLPRPGRRGAPRGGRRDAPRTARIPRLPPLGTDCAGPIWPGRWRAASPVRAW